MVSGLAGSVQVFDDAQTAAVQAAEALLAALRAHSVEKNGLMNVALSGGSTPNAMYDYLAGLSADRGVRAMALRARFFWSDERTVPADHADSNFGQAWNRWLKGLNLPGAQVVRLEGETPAAAAAAAYEARVRALVPAGGDGLPRFDLVMLGMGGDAHTASLFPGTAAVREGSRLVVDNVVPQQKTTRLTFTFPLINAAKQVWILCTGAGKAEALEAVAGTGAQGDDAYPISRVRPAPVEAALTWWLDRAAAAGLLR